MRPTALIPILCGAAALVLGFLCIFAGQKKDFMEDYHIITLNTSRIGYSIINTTTSDSSNPISTWLNSLGDDVKGEINEVAGDIAQQLGIDDFYSVHMLDYCYGDYTPSPLPNATLSASDIHRNVTACSNRTAAFHFDPTTIIEQKLNESGVGVSLADLNWPDDIQKGLDALHIIQTTYFVLYCIAVGFIFLAFVFSVLALFTTGRLSACLNVMLHTLAFLAIALASALVTAVIVKGSNIINKYGAEVGVSAQRGNKFLALTWAATGAMLIAMLWWCFETCFGHRKRERGYVGKQG